MVSSLHKSTESEFSPFKALNHRNDSCSLVPPWCSSVHCDYSGHSLSFNLSFSLSISYSTLSRVFPTVSRLVKAEDFFFLDNFSLDGTCCTL